MINLLVALAAEAKPFNALLGLQACGDGAAFRYYANETHRLVVTGIGSSAMAAACGWLAAMATATTTTQGPGQASAEDVWINVGIAGHRSLALGSLVLAHKIVDQPSGRVWYPPQLINGPNTMTVITVSQPELQYPTDNVYEMEASGFVQAATRFASRELVQSFKVISDNAIAPMANVNASLARQLLSDRATQVLDYANSLQSLCQSLSPSPGNSQLVHLQQKLQARWHFTAMQKKQLGVELRRWAALAGERDQLQYSAFENLPDGRSVIAAVATRVSKLPLSFAP